MAQGDTNITIAGNLVRDPELRFTPSGAAVANFTVASTPRTFNRATNQWEDVEGLFLTCNVWREAAENVAESLTKGMRVIVHGRLRQRSYETREGEKRTVYEIEVDEVGPSLKYAKAEVTRNPRGGGQGGGQGGFGGQAQSTGGFGNQQAQGSHRQQVAQDGQRKMAGYDGSNDPWNSAPQGGFGGADDEAPF